MPQISIRSKNAMETFFDETPMRRYQLLIYSPRKSSVSLQLSALSRCYVCENIVFKGIQGDEVQKYKNRNRIG